MEWKIRTQLAQNIGTENSLGKKKLNTLNLYLVVVFVYAHGP